MHRPTVASRSAALVSQAAPAIIPTTSEAQAHALLEASTAANLAAHYVRTGKLAAAKRKAVQLLKSLQALEGVAV